MNYVQVTVPTLTVPGLWMIPPAVIVGLWMYATQYEHPSERKGTYWLCLGVIVFAALVRYLP